MRYILKGIYKDRKIMQKTIKKISARGFTLIELLVVIAIIGLLSTVIAAPITQARKKGRDGKKVADLRQITGALQQFADDNAGNFPASLDGLVPLYLTVLPPFAATTTAPKDKYMYTNYKTATVGDIRTVGFHMGVKLEAPNLALGEDRDCAGWGTIIPTENWCTDKNADSAGVMLATPGNFTAGTLSSHANDVYNMNGAAVAVYNTAGGTGSTVGDFNGGAETATTTCTALINGLTAGPAGACIYDITN